MEKILVFKTAADATMKKLLFELKDMDVDCLIQSSQRKRYKAEYPNVNFIDIGREGFYSLPDEVTKILSKKKYDQVYVAFSGIKGHNYGNVMELVAKTDFKKAYFYNCNGDRIEMPKQNMVKDMLCRVYIALISFIYELKRG